MNQPDPMPAAAREAAVKAATLASLTAAIIKLILDVLRQQRDQPGTPAQPVRPTDRPHQTIGQTPENQGQTAQTAQARPGGLGGVHEQVLAGLDEPIARALIGSGQLGQFADLLRQVEAAGVDVPTFLAALGPALAREQTRPTASAPTAQPPAPSAPERPGLRERIRESLTRRRGGEAQAAPPEWMSPDDQTWAVTTAVYACGVQGAEQLVASSQWPQIGQDLVTLGYAHQHGFTDIHPAQVLEVAWRALPASVGVDWPTAATVSLGQARDQVRRGGPTPDASTAQAVAPAPLRENAHAQNAHPAPAVEVAGPVSPRAAAATATSNPDPAPAAVSDSSGRSEACEAALARSTGVSSTGPLNVTHHEASPQSAPETDPGQEQRRGR